MSYGRYSRTLRGWRGLLVGTLTLCATTYAEVCASADAPVGLDTRAMDTRVSPGDDFFRYANGTWYREREFAPDETYVGARSNLMAQRRRRVREIVEEVARSPGKDHIAQLVGTFYASCTDIARLDALGTKPLAPDLARARHLASYPELYSLFAEAPLLGVKAPIAGGVFYDFHAPGWLRYTIEPGGLGLPSRELYLDAGEAARETRAAYQIYIADMLALAGEPQAKTKAAAILDLETRLARAQWPTMDAQDFLKTANSLRRDELQKLTPDFPWPAFLERAGLAGIDTVIVRQPSAMGPLLTEISSTPLPTWRAWWVFHLLSDNARYLSRNVAAMHFEFYANRLSGQQAPSPRWELGVELVEGYFGQAVGRLYVQRWFPERNKQMVAELFANIRAVMRERIEQAAWMSASTRAEALKKIDLLTVKIGYPQKWPDYSGVELRADDCYGNLRAARRYSWRERTGLTRQPLDRDLWQTTPQMSGAAANPNLNEITVPAGALEPPYFDPNAEAAVNYGAIGGVLGHELSHMFDQLGRQMDASGKLRDWWAPADAARYSEIARRVEEQYSQFEALPGLHLNGALTINENIADIAGLRLAHQAYHRSLAGRQPAVIGGFTADQRLFLGWAQMRAGKMREATLRRQVGSGPHAPDMFRVNGVVRNIDAWYAAFGVTPDDALYLPAQRRADFW